jgi:hypothetical protein
MTRERTSTGASEAAKRRGEPRGFQGAAGTLAMKGIASLRMAVRRARGEEGEMAVLAGVMEGCWFADRATEAPEGRWEMERLERWR